MAFCQKELLVVDSSGHLQCDVLFIVFCIPSVLFLCTNCCVCLRLCADNTNRLFVVLLAERHYTFHMCSSICQIADRYVCFTFVFFRRFACSRASFVRSCFLCCGIGHGYSTQTKTIEFALHGKHRSQRTRRQSTRVNNMQHTYLPSACGRAPVRIMFANHWFVGRTPAAQRGSSASETNAAS